MHHVDYRRSNINIAACFYLFQNCRFNGDSVVLMFLQQKLIIIIDRHCALVIALLLMGLWCVPLTENQCNNVKNSHSECDLEYKTTNHKEITNPLAELNEVNANTVLLAIIYKLYRWSFVFG